MYEFYWGLARMLYIPQKLRRRRKKQRRREEWEGGNRSRTANQKFRERHQERNNIAAFAGSQDIGVPDAL